MLHQVPEIGMISGTEFSCKRNIARRLASYIPVYSFEAEFLTVSGIVVYLIDDYANS